MRKHDFHGYKHTTTKGGSEKQNPVGKNGQRLKCYRYGSERHLANRCTAPNRVVQAYYRERVENDESHLLLVSDMIKALDETPFPNLPDGNSAHENEPTADSSSASALAEFDSYFAEDNSLPNPISEDDQTWHQAFLSSTGSEQHFG